MKVLNKFFPADEKYGKVKRQNTKVCGVLFWPRHNGNVLTQSTHAK